MSNQVRNFEAAAHKGRLQYWQKHPDVTSFEKGPDLINNDPLQSLTVAGVITDIIKLNASDAIEIPGDLRVTGNIVVTGSSTTGSDISSGTIAAALLFTAANKLEFRAAAQYINSPAVGKLAIVATVAGADDIQLTGGVNVTGTLAVSGAVALASTLAVTGALSCTSPKITTSILDSGGNISIAIAATGSAVNGIGVTNAATGNGTTNPVTLTPSGTDTHVGLTVAPKGASGVLTLGLSTGTADIVLGSSSGTQSVKIGDGAGIVTVNVGNTSIVGVTVSIAGAATATGVTDTVNIATGNTAGTGSKVVHIADGTPAGTNVVTIGSNANTANTTTLKGGNGAGAITLTPQTTGTIVIGAAAGTGNITLGSSSATQTVLIGGGAGASVVSIANVTVAGATVSIAGGVPASGLTDEIDLALGNAASTAKKIVKIATGTPVTSGNNQVTIGGGATSALTFNAVVRSYQAVNYIASETGANNALVAALLDAAGNSVTVAAGLAIAIKLGHTLQAGANTLNLNSHGTDSIKKASAPGTDVAVVAASGSIILMVFDGTVWQVVGQ